MFYIGYSKTIPEFPNKTYWNIFSLLKMYSQQRRMKRYIILYTWKAIANLVLDCGITSRSPEDSRLGCLCEIPAYRVKTLREQSFQVHGTILFNSLPKQMRNNTGFEIIFFKYKLDHFLSQVPFKPMQWLVI